MINIDKKMTKDEASKFRKFGLIFVFIFFLILIGSVYIFISVNKIDKIRREDLSLAANNIQAKITDVVANKIILDSLANKETSQAKNTIDSLHKQSPSIIAQLENLYVPNQVNDYRTVVTAWLKTIENSSRNLDQWATISEQPKDFIISISDEEAEALLKNNSDIILGLKKIGDDAFKNNDKQAMAIVSANLLIQKHWLEGLSYSKVASTNNLLINKSLAYSGAVRPVCFTAHNNNPLCAKELIKFSSDAYKATSGYLKGAPQVQANWDNLWKNNSEIAAELQAPKKESPIAEKQPIFLKFIEERLKSIITPPAPIGNITPASDILGFSLKGSWKSALSGKGLQVYGQIAAGPSTTKIYEDGDIELIIDSVSGNTAVGKIRYFNLCVYGSMTAAGVSTINLPKRCGQDSGYIPIKIRVSGGQLDFDTSGNSEFNFSMRGAYTEHTISGTMTADISPYGLLKGEFHLSRPLNYK